MTENASGHTSKQQEAVRSNIIGMGLIIRTNKSEDILVMLEITVLDDWPYRRVNLDMTLLGRKFCPKNTMTKALQK